MSAPTTSNPPNPSRGNRHRYRGRRNAPPSEAPRRAQDPTPNVPQSASNDSLALRPASLAPSIQSEAHAAQVSNGRNNRWRGGRGGRGGRRGAAGGQIMSAGGRTFGGQLTGSLASSTGLLQADAPSFTPGQALVSRV
jgi:hypothetical protein